MLKQILGLTLGATQLILPSATVALDPLGDLFGGQSALKGKKLKKAIKKASTFPLGSNENPVRAEMPQGQQAYLARLRCADGRAPQFRRVGNFGVGVYGNIIDGYDVTCADSEPAKTRVIIDMYHAGHIENMAVPGFTISTP